MSSADPLSGLFSKIKNEIFSQIKRMSRPATRPFITKAELEEILSTERLGKIFKDTLCNQSETIDRIKKEWLLVVGTLICLDWKKWTSFELIFMNEQSGVINDRRLPFRSTDEILGEAHLDDGFAREFYRVQWVFTPMTIVQYDDSEAQPEERLPFQDSKTISERGAFSTVLKHSIPAGYMHEVSSDSTSVNMDVSLDWNMRTILLAVIEC